MVADAGGLVQAFKRLLRATGVEPGNAFLPAPGGGAAVGAWCNTAVSTRDTVATCELATGDDFGPCSPALLWLRVRPACPGRAFPTACVISLATSAQRLDALALQDVVVRAWPLHPAGAETTIAVRTLYHIAALLGAAPGAGARVFLTLRFRGCCDASDTHRIAAVELRYAPPQLHTVEVALTLSPTPRRDASSSEGELPPPPPPPLRLLSAGPRAGSASSEAGSHEEEEGDKDDVLAAHVAHATPRSPRRRSVTQPRRTIFVNIDTEEEEEDVIEVPTSPCTTRSTASRRPTLPCAVPRREAPASPQSTSSDDGVSAPAGCRGKQQQQQQWPALREVWSAPSPVSASPLPARAAFVVPDRRDFVAVGLLQQRQEEEERRRRRYLQRISMPWGEADAAPAVTPHGTESTATAVEKNRRRIQSLQGVPAYEAEHDLLRTATELLGLRRETLLRRRPSADPSRRLSVRHDEERDLAPARQPPASAEAVEPPPSPSAAAAAAAMEVGRERLAAPERLTPTLETPAGGAGAEPHAPRQPLADRSAEINLPRGAAKAAAKGDPPREAQPAPGPAPSPHDTSLPASEASCEPSLLVQVEPPPCWGENVSLGSRAAAAPPHVGTFLVWKHHFSRRGTAKRILALQREGEAVLLTLRKLDRQRRAPQMALRRAEIEVVTGLQAYYSNAIHRGHVHAAECCLVVSRGGQQVAAVEMQSVGELRLAAQLLLPACASSGPL
ncbi:uncharacterized protein Tco025E_07146 [Trypanosoma conorhini]|uniref:PH-like domain-containing protein n=1 Tax=Trypanosoma conorhini TaxID=83891 RepID=A0A3S5IRV8_9TRYP|nr:uncharacterized protein Tco025E_07146 [Trypanosoma conorhini]RNF09063.1 hypothetical protein Tco025E_07146 [Trypanosoma conorhini]